MTFSYRIDERCSPRGVWSRSRSLYIELTVSHRPVTNYYIRQSHNCNVMDSFLLIVVILIVSYFVNISIINKQPQGHKTNKNTELETRPLNRKI